MCSGDAVCRLSYNAALDMIKEHREQIKNWTTVHNTDTTLIQKQYEQIKKLKEGRDELRNDTAATELKVAAQVIDNVSVNFERAARADNIYTIMVASPYDQDTHKFWVEIVKNRYGNTSKHTFLTLQDALDFIEKHGEE